MSSRGTKIKGRLRLWAVGALSLLSAASCRQGGVERSLEAAETQRQASQWAAADGAAPPRTEAESARGRSNGGRSTTSAEAERAGPPGAGAREVATERSSAERAGPSGAGARGVATERSSAERAGSLGAGARGVATERSSAVSTERVRVRAKKPIGVPVHPEDGARVVSGRFADGQLVEVLGRGATGWYLVKGEGLRGWISPRYVDRRRSAREGRAPGAPSEHAERCRRELNAAPRGRTEPPRVASWNVRWFPDGGGSAAATDIEWLACEMVRLGAPVIAVQEFTSINPEQGPLRRLLAELNRLSRGRFRAAFDRCPARRFQHVGLLYDETRVRGSHFTQLDQLNPAQGCTNRLRPGLSGYFRFPQGPDLHVVSVHLKADVQRSSLRKRRQSLRRLPSVVAQLRRAVDDADVLIAGDLNTVGSEPGVSAEQELTAIDALLANHSPPFRRVPSTCSHYYGGAPNAVDHFLITARSSELPRARAASVEGYCQALGCKGSRELPAHYERLSDHCPIVVELDPRDDD